MEMPGCLGADSSQRKCHGLPVLDDRSAGPPVGSSKYDVVVTGGGHNGLVKAAYLARAGKKALVCERRHVLGGGAVTEEVFPGFQFSVASYVVSPLRPEIIRELDLPGHDQFESSLDTLRATTGPGSHLHCHALPS